MNLQKFIILFGITTTLACPPNSGAPLSETTENVQHHDTKFKDDLDESKGGSVGRFLAQSMSALNESLHSFGKRDTVFAPVLSFGDISFKRSCKMVYFNEEKDYTCAEIRFPFNYQINYVDNLDSLMVSTMAKNIADVVMSISGQMSADQKRSRCKITVLSFRSIAEEDLEDIRLPFSHISKNDLGQTIKSAFAYLNGQIPLPC